MEYSLDLRRRIVAAYRSGKSGTYKETAELFGVGLATVSRLLRLERETNDVKARPRGGNNPRAVDRDWLLGHAKANPDALLRERIDAWEKKSGRRVSMGAMWNAMHAIGWTHKKRRRAPVSANAKTSKRSAKRSSRARTRSTRRD
jgi:transposase